MAKANLGKQLMQLNRDALGTLTVTDLKNILDDLEPSERKEYVARVAAVWDILESVFDWGIGLQVDHAIRTTENWDQVLIARGGVNIGEVYKAYFKSLVDEHTQNIQPKEPFDPHQVL